MCAPANLDCPPRMFKRPARTRTPGLIRLHGISRLSLSSVNASFHSLRIPRSASFLPLVGRRYGALMMISRIASSLIFLGCRGALLIPMPMYVFLVCDPALESQAGGVIKVRCQTYAYSPPWPTYHVAIISPVPLVLKGVFCEIESRVY
jgi:hypothetical protein